MLVGGAVEGKRLYCQAAAASQILRFTLVELQNTTHSFA
jgi:hypothetical protein